MSNLKRCRQCQQTKKESQFRHIKYFDKRRSICKRCEALERRKQKKYVENHVKEHGVTPGILQRIRQSSYSTAHKKVRQAVFSRMAARTRILYSIGKLSYAAAFVLTLALLPVFAVRDETYLKWETVLLVDGALVLVALLTKGVVKSVDRQIATECVPIRDALFQKALRERIKYEAFYRSTEWRILRNAFLRGRKRADGRYVCYLCGRAIFPASELTVDHIKPRSRFPELAMSLDNLLIACRQCNSSKGDRVLTEKKIAALLEKNKAATK